MIGSDSFQYTIRDGSGRTATATVTVTVGATTEPVYLGCYNDTFDRDLSGFRFNDFER